MQGISLKIQKTHCLVGGGVPVSGLFSLKNKEEEEGLDGKVQSKTSTIKGSDPSILSLPKNSSLSLLHPCAFCKHQRGAGSSEQLFSLISISRASALCALHKLCAFKYETHQFLYVFFNAVTQFSHTCMCGSTWTHPITPRAPFTSQFFFKHKIKPTF